MDSNATRHITNDLDNLNITNSYHAQDQLIVDGTALPIAHTRNTILHTQIHSSYQKFYMFPALHKTCYQFHLYVKLTQSLLNFSQIVFW